jgi:ABC-2 type transport system permease protein
VPGIKNVSIRQWALTAADAILGNRAEGLGVESAVSLPAGLGLLAAVTVIGIVLGVRRLQTLPLTSAD